MKLARLDLHAGRVLLLALMLFTVLPFVSIFMTALHPSGSLPGALDWPTEPQWSNFADAFRVAEMGTLLRSSIMIVLGVVPVSLVIATMAGFAVGLLGPPGSRFLLMLFIFGLTLPFEGIVIPLYYLAREIGILNTRLAIILPLVGTNSAFGTFWMRAYFRAVPRQLIEAAALDGAGSLRILWKSLLPGARPAPLVAGAIGCFARARGFLLALRVVQVVALAARVGARDALAALEHAERVLGLLAVLLLELLLLRGRIGLGRVLLRLRLTLAVFLLLLGGGERALLGVLALGGRRGRRRRALGSLDRGGPGARRRRIAADALAVRIVPALDLGVRRAGEGEREHED